MDMRIRVGFAAVALTAVLGLGQFYNGEAKRFAAKEYAEKFIQDKKLAGVYFRTDKVNASMSSIQTAAMLARYDILIRLNNGENPTWSDYNTIEKLKARGLLTRELTGVSALSAAGFQFAPNGVLYSDPVLSCEGKVPGGGVLIPMMDQSRFETNPDILDEQTVCVKGSDDKYRLGIKLNPVHLSDWEQPAVASAKKEGE